jgi:hypothetical protein
MSFTPLQDRNGVPSTPAPPQPSFNTQFTANPYFSTPERSRDSPATREPPRKKRKSDENGQEMKCVTQMDDGEVWNWTDEAILGAPPSSSP